MQKAHRLSKRMWSGFGAKAAGELELIKVTAHTNRRRLSSAEWDLARWYAFNGDYGRALDNLFLLQKTDRNAHKHFRVQVLMVECLLQLGRSREAQRWLSWATRRVKNPRTEIYLTSANICYARAAVTGIDVSAEHLNWLNRAYAEAGFSRIEKRDESAPLSLDNLTVHNPRPVDAPVKLSVLMPAYNCANTLPVALRSILEQTWHNLELIVVDDKSSDETWSIIEQFAQHDSRIIPIRHEQNGGAYAARNTALACATGEYVTVHDADDWSHPEKFAAQMLYALSEPDGASTTVGVRVSRDLRFGVKSNVGGMIIENTSSLLVKRELLVDLGGWDVTRVGADSELYERVKARSKLATKRAAKRLFPQTPLSLILYSSSSLTQSSATGIDTVSYGARRQYKEAYRFWHETELARREPDLRVSSSRRFPAPRIVLGWREVITDIDVMIVGNFAAQGRSFQEDVARWTAMAEVGLKIGIAHWPSFDDNPTSDIVRTVRSAIAAGVVENIVPGETVSCRITVLLNPELLDNPPSSFPVISTRDLYMANQSELTDVHKAESERFFGRIPDAISEDYLSPVLARQNAKQTIERLDS